MRSGKAEARVAEKWKVPEEVRERLRNKKSARALGSHQSRGTNGRNGRPFIHVAQRILRMTLC